MGTCTRRHFLLSICLLQLLTIIERQVFDFLGYMWAPILANLLHIIFVIFGFFGIYQFRAKYITTYSIWNLIWIGWNVFLVCFYLSVGLLDKNSDILNLGTGSVSWFEVNGFGCKPFYQINLTTVDPFRPVRPERVENCLLNYPEVEIIHSGLQLILSILAIIGAIFIAKIFLDEDDRFDFMGGDAKSPQHTVVHPMYVSYSCIPTATTTTTNATTLSPKAGVYSKSNASNTNSLASLYNQNLKHTNIGFTNNSNNHKPEIRYTELSTEQLVNDLDDSHENCILKNMQTFHNDSEIKIHNHEYMPSKRLNQNVPYAAYDNQYNFRDTLDNHNKDEHNNIHTMQNSLDSFTNNTSNNSFRSDIVSHRNRNVTTNQFAQQIYPNDSDQIPENYIMPIHYVTRSPNLNRSSSRKRKDHFYANVYDQIRDTPPGYDRNYSMQRVRSHDRLAQRKQNNGRGTKTRPRSYCSNGSFPEAL